MDLRKKRDELINLITHFLHKQKNVKKLQDFSNEVIDFFSDSSKKLPSVEQFENEFWYAIWQIQHLADEEHEKDGTLQRELSTTLKYLLNEIPMPSGTYGLRPAG